MQIAIIGLGKMGMNMARRLLRGGHEVWVYNRTPEKSRQLQSEGAHSLFSLDDVISALSPPRTVWLMLPAGEATEYHVQAFSKLLLKGDILVDGGNGYFKDDTRRARTLSSLGIHYVDAGVSGGIWGLTVGYCTMVGGDASVFNQIEPLLKTLAPPEGYLYCGGTGSGHFVKMIHNGIEYAMMEAYGEGFELLRASPYRKSLNFKQVAHLWNQGSVIRSWLLELLESAFEKDPDLKNIGAHVEDSGEGRWTVLQAVESGVSAVAIAHALFKRFQSRDPDLFSDKVLAALRNEFGGHAIQLKD